ncbi:hypothetical protein GCM10023142_05650 [Anaerocolumna aminovalerica]|uniref:Uncharacterized protein n=2 Tax=Anaerocolumna aminovalerica TaxID=1527 RepID=A0A1I5CJH4_9FIRM|nr:hypothetical protein SAMN04489757_103103 [Anaerocolumna aminovalerica]
MYLGAKKMAFLGLLLAISVVLVILSGVFEFNTIFLLAGASFCIGIAIRECGIRLGLGFFIGSSILSFFMASNKFYCITFSAMGLYILINEFAWEKLSKIRNRNLILWVIKYSIFNIIYLPSVIIMPHLFYQGTIRREIWALVILGGQIALFIFDKAYDYFQTYVWGKFRRRFHIFN